MLHKDITEQILQSCFEVINELGAGFLESVYKKSLVISLREKGFFVEEEKPIPVSFRGHLVGNFFADLVVNNSVIIELKCCKCLVSENSAQVINYLKASGMTVGLLINFGNKNLEYKRLQHPSLISENKTILASS